MTQDFWENLYMVRYQIEIEKGTQKTDDITEVGRAGKPIVWANAEELLNKKEDIEKMERIQKMNITTKDA